MPDRLMALSLGGIRLNVILDEREKALFGHLNDLFGRYAVAPGDAQCRIQIAPFSYSTFYRWNFPELEVYRQLCASIHSRYPPARRPARVVEESLGLLQRCDPTTPAVRKLRLGLQKPAGLMHATSASDLFFYDPHTDTATLLLKMRARRKNMLPGVLNGVMWGLSYRLLQHKGLLLHGCAICKNGRSMLFLGRSGDGKSTVARLCSPDVCFSDDGVIIRKSADKFLVYPSPFRQSNTGDDPSSEPGEIEKIFLLEKSDRTQVLPLDKSTLMRIVLDELIHFFKYVNRQSAEKGFETVRRMVASLPVFRLRFAKSGKVWDNISGRKTGDGE